MKFILKKTSVYRTKDHSSESFNYIARVDSMYLDQFRSEKTPDHLREGKVHARNLIKLAEQIAQFPWEIGDLEFAVEKEQTITTIKDKKLYVVTNEWKETEAKEIYGHALIFKRDNNHL